MVLDVSDSRFLPAVLMTILGVIFTAACILSCCRRGLCAGQVVFFYMSEYSDLLASLAVFVVLPAEISKLLRQRELDTSAETWGWTELEASSFACESWCGPMSCNQSDCFGCGLCNVSLGQATSRCPALQVERCALGAPEIVVDCPELTTNVPLPVYILHTFVSSLGVVHVLSSLVTNPRPFRSYGFYAFVAWRRRGRWFQRYLRAFVSLLALELCASVVLATLGNGHNGHADRTVRVYEICGVMLAILVDLASQWERGGDAPSAPALACPVQLALPCYTRASTAMANVDHAMLVSLLHPSQSQSAAEEANATPPTRERHGERSPLERLVLAEGRPKSEVVSSLREAMAGSTHVPPGGTGGSSRQAQEQHGSALSMGSHSHGRLSTQLVALSPRLARQLSGSGAGGPRLAETDELQRLREPTLLNESATTTPADETRTATRQPARHGTSSVPLHQPEPEAVISSDGSSTAQPSSRWPSTVRVLTTGHI